MPTVFALVRRAAPAPRARICLIAADPQAIALRIRRDQRNRPGPAAGCRDQCALMNCSLSVEPDRAVVEASGVIADVTRSKYPVPTSRWCLVAV